MTSITRSNNPRESPFNPGKIFEVNDWPRWKTKVGPFELTLDIVSVGQPEKEDLEIGIASFVVMEQEPPFLDYVANRLAKAITRQTRGKDVLLMTVESKGSHLIPWVWENLSSLKGKRLMKRIIVLRKGKPKIYMKRPVKRNGQKVILSPVTFHSITSSDKQSLNISPKDAEFLFHAIKDGAKPVIVDDFIGKGGTIIAICHLFKQLRLEPPELLAVIGSDGNLYEQTFVQEDVDIKLLPQPFPLKLPTFLRKNSKTPWKINT